MTDQGSRSKKGSVLTRDWKAFGSGPLTLIYLVFLSMSGVYLAETLKLPLGNAGRPGAGFYPLWVGVAFLLLSGFLFVQSLMAPKHHGAQEEAFPRGRDLQRVLAIIGILAGSVALLRTFGYGLCSAAMTAGALRVLGMRGWKRIVVVTILTAVSSYYLFAVLLGVPLPRGFFFE